MTAAMKRTRLGALSAVVLCAWAALVGCAGQPVPTPNTQQYYVMIFDDAAPVTDAAFNACFDNERIPDARTLPGFVSAQRFQLNTPQMYPGVTVALPRYLALYQIATNDLTATMAQLQRTAGTTGAGTCPGVNRTTADVYAYRFSAPRQDRTAPDQNVPAGGTRTNYVHIVFTVPRQAAKDQFEHWYLTSHIPQLLTRPGFTSAQRVAIAQAHGAVPPTDTAAVFRLSLPTTMSVAADTQLPPPGAPPNEAGRMLDPTQNRGYTYRAIGPVISASPAQ